MSQSNLPPAGSGGPAARVHHPQQGQGPAGQGLKVDPQVNPELLILLNDYKEPGLPPMLYDYNGRPIAAPPPEAPKAPQPETREQRVGESMQRMQAALLQDLAKLPAAFGDVFNLSFLAKGIDPEVAPVDLPYNNLQVRAGGFAVLKVLLGPIKDADSLAEDKDKLAKELAAELATLEHIRSLRPPVETAFKVIVANETRSLSRVAGIVQAALKRGKSVIEANGALVRELAPALAIKGAPSDQSVASRADNQRREEAVRSDEQSKMQGQGPATPPPATKVTTEVPSAPPADSPKAPVPSKGHGKKSGQ